MEAVAILVAGLLIREGLMNVAATFGAIAAMLHRIEVLPGEQREERP